MANEAPISLSIDRGIAVATLCRPPVNAIDDAWVERLNRVLDAVESDEQVRVLWIRSEQRVFCAGADLAFMRQRFATAEGRREMIAFTRRLQQVYARIEHSPRVSLAEIGGAALGGGFELALACDLRVVADEARVGLPEARLGLLPAAGGTQRMTRICGEALARRLILGAEVVQGAEAGGLGLAQWHAPAAQLREVAGGIAERLAALPSAALRESKRCIGAALDARLDGYEIELEGSGTLLALQQTQERVRRFLERDAS
ncbi:MAG: enoyl-CoA hydratase/isomerase family protein [Burkholderiaceae bacterium]|nr:enoyl-CoA hydratase/isomerase family protein [Burkholderiaceae bacterium]